MAESDAALREKRIARLATAGRIHQHLDRVLLDDNGQENTMQITEADVTPHHLLAAERWIAANGMPATDAELARMGLEVAEEARQAVEHMACKTFEALDAHHEDRKAGVETLAGMQGRELLHDVYTELRRRARGESTMDLDKIKLFHSPLTDTIYLGREGKKAGVALDKRKAEADVMSVLVQHMMHDSPHGSVKTIAIGGQQYEVTVKPTG